jgi:hypothetical protein
MNKGITHRVGLGYGGIKRDFKYYGQKGLVLAKAR